MVLNTSYAEYSIIQKTNSKNRSHLLKLLPDLFNKIYKGLWFRKPSNTYYNPKYLLFSTRS